MKLQTQIINLTIIAILGLQVPPISTVQAIYTETVEIKQSLEGIDGLLQESSQVNLKADADSVGMAKINNTIIDIPKNSDEAVSLKTGNTEINISLPELDNPQEGEIVAKGVVAYTSESDFSNTVQANNDGSVRMTTIIDNPNAPTEYEYKVALEQGGKIKIQTDGSAIVYNNKQEPISIIAKPWAKDAEGKEVKTWFSTYGLTLIQHVEHNVAGVFYPVVADPWWLFPCKQYISNSYWSWRGGHYTFNINPTTCARSNARGFVQEAVNELLVKSNMWGWTNWFQRQTVIDQYICHIHFAGHDPQWNLEITRPYVGYRSTVLQKCNPK
jgi:hypothetical protein